MAHLFREPNKLAVAEHKFNHEHHIKHQGPDEANHLAQDPLQQREQRGWSDHVVANGWALQET